MEESWLSARHWGADGRGLGSDEGGGLGLGEPKGREGGQHSLEVWHIWYI